MSVILAREHLSLLVVHGRLAPVDFRLKIDERKDFRFGISTMIVISMWVYIYICV